MWVNGKWTEAISGRTYPVVNPANGEEIASVPLGDMEYVSRGVKAARDAFPI
jgi:acyl-CoA reductase-like NAD-dependent aldehyde dehydrogenase